MQTSTGDEADNACGWGVKVSHARCELSGMGDAADAYLEPWRCASALPGRIVAPPLHYQVNTTNYKLELTTSYNLEFTVLKSSVI